MSERPYSDGGGRSYSHPLMSRCEDGRELGSHSEDHDQVTKTHKIPHQGSLFGEFFCLFVPSPEEQAFCRQQSKCPDGAHDAEGDRKEAERGP